MDINAFAHAEHLRGIWFMLHMLAVEAITSTLKDAFVHNVLILCARFPCQKCKHHFQHFIDTHPFSNYRYIRDQQGRDIGFFQWTWELHNAVNARLDKPYVGLNIAYEFYAVAQMGLCLTCGDPEDPVTHPTPTTYPASTTHSQERLDVTLLDDIEPEPTAISQAPINPEISRLLTLYHTHQLVAQPF